jgi:hypothetical protein
MMTQQQKPAPARKVACPACCGVSGSPRFTDCRLCNNDGVVSEQTAKDYPTDRG